MSRRFPWVLASVPWSDQTCFTRGTWHGKPLFSCKTADRSVLATPRQLAAMGKRPGGQDPVAFLYFRCRKAGKLTFANLYLIEKAKPKRPMTPARWEAHRKMMAARRTCRECGETGWAELPKAHRTCEACLCSAGLDPGSYLHDYLVGEPTLTPEDYASFAAVPNPLTWKGNVAMTTEPRAARISDAINAAFARVGEMDRHRPAESGRLLPTDTAAADLYAHAASLAEALALDMRAAELAFRPVLGVDQDPGGAAA